MIPRTRERSRLIPGGQRKIGTGVADYGPITFEYQKVEDYYQKHRDPRFMLPGSNCTMIKDTLKFDPIYYKKVPQNNIGTQWVVGKVASASNTMGVAPATVLPTFDEAATLLIERTNPFRPVYSIPVEFIEMITLTDLFRSFGTKILQWLGAAHLTNEFALKPFQGGIRALDDILKHLEYRIREWNALVGRGGLHRRIPIAKDSVYRIIGNDESLNSSPNGTSVRGVDERFIKEEIYGSVRWYPKLGKLPPTDPIVLTRRCLKVLLDVDQNTMGWASAWEAIPFSWLVDYFTNIGNILNADRGRQLVYPAYISVSKKTYWTRKCTAKSWNTNCRGGSFELKRERLERKVYPEGWSATTVAVNSILSQNQFMNVLALIAILQGGKFGKKTKPGTIIDPIVPYLP